MSKLTTEQFDKKFFMTEQLYDYMLAHSLRELPILRELRQHTQSLRGKHMISPPEQVQFMQFLLKILQPKQVLEIGVFTGYTTLAMALAGGETCHITGLELNEQWADITTSFWQRAGVAEQINMRYGDALETLQSQLAGQAEVYDFIFLDADKERYIEYYEACLPLLKPGGVLMADNVFSWGLVADDSKSKRLVQKMRLFNKHVHADSRVDITMLPMADGFTLVRKR